ncbi:MAG TPA: DUF411 domain-containing protein [Gammaproteobacteria bacterium]|nr:DUF411 domain-containing protein [Gammaproteobacteria bacterium]
MNFGKKVHIVSTVSFFVTAFTFSPIVHSAETIEVWKSPTCGCCKKWVSHLEKNGFNVVTHNTKKMQSIKDDFGVPKKLRSCHTAKIGQYIIEGHVPASDINELLKTNPKEVKVLSAPGMPAGSPGMEMGKRFDPYPTVTYNANKEFTLFNYHSE